MKVRTQAYSPKPITYTADGTTIPGTLAGVCADPYEKLPRTRRINTNANRRNGGSGTYWNPRTSRFYGK